MAAGTAYAKRYAGGFVDKPTLTTAIDSTFLNAVEVALLQLIGAAPSADSQVMQWDDANTRFGPALILNKNIGAGAAIAKSKLDFTGANGIVNADVAGAAAIARSKLDFGSGLVNADLAAAAAIALSKLAGYPTDASQIPRGDGTWSRLGVYRKTTTKTVNTSVAATDLLNGEITIAAGLMGATGIVRMTAWGDWLQNSGGASAPPRFALKFGGTTVIDTNAATAGGAAAGATRQPWRISVEIVNTAANAQFTAFELKTIILPTAVTTNSFFATGEGNYYASSLVGGNALGVVGQGFNVGTALDTATAKLLELYVTNPSASATYETKLFGALVEVL